MGLERWQSFMERWLLWIWAIQELWGDMEAWDDLNAASGRKRL